MPPGRVSTSSLSLDIVPLSAERLGDLARLFGQGGDPKFCWCAFYRVRGIDFSKATAAANRKVLESHVEMTRAQDRAPGLVAYLDGEVVGWVSVGPRSDYERLTYSRVLAPVDDKPVWSIVCFVVARRARGQGVATVLLHAAVDYARSHGARWVEAYPADAGSGPLPAASAYKGTVSMFERAGFKVAAKRRANASSAPRPIVRKRLSPPRSRR